MSNPLVIIMGEILHVCPMFGNENSFLCALGQKLDFLASGSYADVLAHCAPRIGRGES